jgi:hypothetical protein
VIDNVDVDAAVALGADRPPNAASAPTSDSGGGVLGTVWLAGLFAALLALALARLRGARH